MSWASRIWSGSALDSAGGRDQALVQQRLHALEGLGVVDRRVGTVVLAQRDLVHAEPLHRGQARLAEVLRPAVELPVGAVAGVSALGRDQDLVRDRRRTWTGPWRPAARCGRRCRSSGEYASAVSMSVRPASSAARMVASARSSSLVSRTDMGIAPRPSALTVRSPIRRVCMRPACPALPGCQTRASLPHPDGARLSPWHWRPAPAAHDADHRPAARRGARPAVVAPGQRQLVRGAAPVRPRPRRPRARVRPGPLRRPGGVVRPGGGQRGAAGVVPRADLAAQRGRPAATQGQHDGAEAVRTRPAPPAAARRR